MSAPRNFLLDDVLSVATGRLLSGRRMAGVYDIMGHITGDPHISTIGIAMGFKAAQSYLLALHPELIAADDELRALEAAGDLPADWPAWLAWVAGVAERHGWPPQISIEPMPTPRLVSIEEQVAYIHAVNPATKVIVAVAP